MENREQIEEMTKDVFELGVKYIPYIVGYEGDIAEYLINKGYRKASEVAEEIFAEIAKTIRHYDELAERDKSEYGELIVMDIGCALAELKKKYTEGEK